jgi:hypothetical protein
MDFSCGSHTRAGKLNACGVSAVWNRGGRSTR